MSTPKVQRTHQMSTTLTTLPRILPDNRNWHTSVGRSIGIQSVSQQPQLTEQTIFVDACAVHALRCPRLQTKPTVCRLIQYISIYLVLMTCDVSRSHTRRASSTAANVDHRSQSKWTYDVSRRSKHVLRILHDWPTDWPCSDPRDDRLGPVGPLMGPSLGSFIATKAKCCVIKHSTGWNSKYHFAEAVD